MIFYTLYYESEKELMITVCSVFGSCNFHLSAMRKPCWPDGVGCHEQREFITVYRGLGAVAVDD